MHLFGISHPIGHQKAFEVEEEDSLWGPPQNQEEDGEEGRPAAPNPRSLGQNGAASMLAENIHAFAHAYIFFAHQLKQLAYNADLPDGTPMVQVESSLTPDQVNWEELAEAVGDKGLAHILQEVCRLTKWKVPTAELHQVGEQRHDPAIHLQLGTGNPKLGCFWPAHAGSQVG